MIELGNGDGMFDGSYLSLNRVLLMNSLSSLDGKTKLCPLFLRSCRVSLICGSILYSTCCLFLMMFLKRLSSACLHRSTNRMYYCVAGIMVYFNLKIKLGLFINILILIQLFNLF